MARSIRFGIWIIWISVGLGLQAAEKHVVFLIAEDEYRASETLPEFAKGQLADNFRITFLRAEPEDRNAIPGMAVLKQADLVVMYVRRRALPAEQMRHFKDCLRRGVPLLALRTSSHAWDTRNRAPAGLEEWKAFDAEVLGGNYQGHHGTGKRTVIALVPGMDAHPLVKGIDITRLIGQGSLYRTSPLAPSAQVILTGSIVDQKPEPVVWTHRYGKAPVVYLSLGHAEDFAQLEFQRLLRNAVHWLTTPDRVGLR